MVSPESFSLRDRVAVITGACGGIGRVLAPALARFGADIVAIDNDLKTYPEVEAQVAAQGRRAMGIRVDVTDPAQVAAMVAQAMERFGHIDILLNCAGIAIRKPSVSFPIDEWQRVMDVNLKGTFLCCQAVGRVMIEQKRGKIINISSTRGEFGLPGGYAAYCPSKAGVNLLTKTLAVEWAPYNIEVNAIAPTYTKTAFTAQLFANKAFYESVVAGTPKGRVGEPEDLIGPVVFLASEASNFVTGHILYVDGGYSAQ